MSEISQFRPHGFFEIVLIDRDQVVFGETQKCVHCGAHWVMKKGSGKLRGYCFACCGPFCGPQCEECVPEEVLVENYEWNAYHPWEPRALNYRRRIIPTNGNAFVRRSQALSVNDHSHKPAIYVPTNPFATSAAPFAAQQHKPRQVAVIEEATRRILKANHGIDHTTATAGPKESTDAS